MVIYLTRSAGDDKTEIKDRVPEHKVVMERLSKAIEKGLAIATLELVDTQHDKTNDNRRIVNIMFNNSSAYAVPWSACRTWKVCLFLVSNYHF